MLSINALLGLIWKTILGYFVFFVAFLSVPAISGLWASVNQSDDVQNFVQQSKYLVIGDTKVRLLIADTDTERMKGLSGRSNLKDDQGMFFIFDKNDRHGIWMKEMFFPIDIIWLDNSFQVVDFVENVTPDSYPQIYKPKKEALYVLEVNSGFVKREGVKISDQATFLK